MCSPHTGLQAVEEPRAMPSSWKTYRSTAVMWAHRRTARSILPIPRTDATGTVRVGLTIRSSRGWR